MQLKVGINDTVWDVMQKVAEKDSKLSWSNPSGNYIDFVTYDGVTIGEFTNGQLTGWMYTLNGTHPHLGVSEQYLEDGDVIVFHYTDDYTQEEGIGAEGAGYGEDLEFYPPKDDPVDPPVDPEEEARKKLEQAKATAKTVLSEYKDLSDYRTAEQEEIGRIITEGRSAIDAAETEVAVKALLTEYKGKIDQLKTIVQYEAEEELAQKVKAAAIKKAKAAKTTISVKALTKHRAKVTWKKVTLSYIVDGKKYSRAVTGYKVYRATKKAGKYKLIKTVKKAKTLKYTDKKLKKGRQYYYKVRTYTKIGDDKFRSSWSSKEMSDAD